MHYNKNDNYKDLLLKCFKADKDLIENWHIEAGNGLETCVNRTYSDLISNNVQLFELIENNETIGYFGKELAYGGLYLTGFFIMPKFRNKDTIMQFWNCVNKEFSDKYFCGIYKKNKPAFEFLIKNNGLVCWEYKDSVFIMMNWKE